MILQSSLTFSFEKKLCIAIIVAAVSLSVSASGSPLGISIIADFNLQCRKLGLLPPDEHLPSKCRQSYQQIWANNGDAISRQYAGTAALKVMMGLCRTCEK